MQESCPCGSVRGASGNRRPYRDTGSKDGRSNHSRPENKGLGAATGLLLHCAALMGFRGPLRP